VIQPSTRADFSCLIFNSDGSEAKQCGNGMRCVARYLHENKLTPKNEITIETKAGVVSALIHDYSLIKVNMGVPSFEPALIPFKVDRVSPLYDIVINPAEKPLKLAVLSMGNPHAILQVASVAKAPVSTLGPQIAALTVFPDSVNVGFMEVVARDHIRLRTFERGAGETLCCGSNACASVVAGIANNLLDNQVTVELLNGNLSVEWHGNQQPVPMSGSTSVSFAGNFVLT
jgi:diaminopimelate epimerase